MTACPHGRHAPDCAVCKLVEAWAEEIAIARQSTKPIDRAELERLVDESKAPA